MRYLLGQTVSVKCVCAVGTLSWATLFVSEVVRLLPMRERHPLYTTFIFYTPVCAFM